MPIAQLIRDTLAEHADSIAIEREDLTRTYAELAERSDRVAAGLLAAGVEVGDRVALLDRNSPAHWELLFGALKVGAIFVPLNFRLLEDEIAWLLEDSDPRILFVGADNLATVPADTTVQIVELEDDGDRGYERWLAAHEPHDPRRDVGPEGIVEIIYSSGTTGRPKGVLVGAGQLDFAMRTFGSFFDIDAESRNLVPAPYFHIAGAGWTLITFLRGGTVLELRDPTPQGIVGGLTAGGATHAVLVPALLTALTGVDGLTPELFPSLRQIVYGASPISEPVLRASIDTFAAEMFQSYGLSETLGTTSVLTASDHDLAGGVPKLASAGRSVPNVEIEIRSLDDGSPVATGDSGEVVVRGPSVTPGYWRNETATEEAFTADGFFRTGDVGYIDEDGYVFLRDRVKDMIVSGGENIYPAEVESVLAAHPDVADVAVIGVPSEKWGESAAAIVVPVPGHEIDEAAFIAWSRERMAHYKCPTSVFVTTELPRNPSGKVLKRELRDEHWAGQERQIN